MISIVDFIKTFTHFSRKISRSNFIVWMGLGPFLLILVLSIAFSKVFFYSKYFPLVLVLSLILNYKWKIKGFVVSSSVFILFHFLTVKGLPKELIIWQYVLSCCILIAFLITALASAEISRFLSNQWLHKDQSAMELAEKRAGLEESDRRIRYLESALSSSKSQLEEKNSYCESLKDLVQLAQEKETALREDHEMLVKQLEEKHVEFSEQALPKEHSETSLDIPFLNELNQLRVENYQMRILLETYQQELEKYKKIDLDKNRLLFEKQEKTAQLDFLDDKQGQEWRHIVKLTKERDMLKKEYENLLKQIEKLQKNGNKEDSLINIEDELLALKKEQEEASFDMAPTEKSLYDYLSFTDQECLRLEDENRKLKEIIDNLSQG